MSGTLSGPMFEPADDGIFKSISGKEGAHYNIFRVLDDNGMAALRQFFPKGEADELNFVLFSTSGVHGTYGSIKEAANELKNPDPEEGDALVTFLIVQPRICCLRYGNCRPLNDADIQFLRKLRASSKKAVMTIGND